MRFETLLDVFAAEPFQRRATFGNVQLGTLAMGFGAIDQTISRVAVCDDNDCAVGKS